MRTEFCLLNTEDGENLQEQAQLCLTYGSCVILYEDQIKKLCQFEVQKQVQKKMIQEHNAMSQENIKKIKKQVHGISMLTKFVY